MDVRSHILTSVTWNVNSLRKRSKIIRVYAALKANNFPDIVCLQETHSDEYLGKRYKQKFLKYNITIVHGTNNSRGVALLIKKTVLFTLVHEILDTEGRYILLKGIINKENITFGSIYAPDATRERKAFFDKLLRLGFEEKHLIFGDFNSVQNHRLDRNRARALNDPDAGDKEFIDLIRFSNSIEAWRHFHHYIHEYSYSRHRRNGPHSRLDHVLVTSQFIDYVKKVYFISDYRVSDHKMLRLDFDFGPQMIGSDFKKIRPQIFDTQIFKDKFQILWNNTLQNLTDFLLEQIQLGFLDANRVFSTPGIVDWKNEYVLGNLNLDASWWQNFKNKVVKLGFQVQRSENKRLKGESVRLNNLLAKVTVETQRERLEKQLLKIYVSMSQQTWVDTNYYDRLKNERCCADFLKLFSSEKKALIISDLKTDTGIVLTAHDEKNAYLVEKYTELYNIKFPICVDPNRFDKYLRICNLVPKVPGDIFQNTEKFSVEEIETVVKKALKNKSPGLDGLPVEFYKNNFKNIGPFITQVFNSVFDTGDLPTSWNTALIKLIPKKPDNIIFDTLRPLQMIVNDAKFYADAWAIRLAEVMPYVINHFQSGGIKGRNVQASILLIHLLFHYYSIKKEKGFVFSIDNKKAFDKFNREFLFFAMKIFNINEKMVDAVAALYENNFCKISVNGFFSEPFPIKNGVRQGCPLSAALYVLGVEPMVRAVHQNVMIQFLTLPNNNQIKSIQHMDDANFFVKNKFSILETIKAINKFNNVSGAELNFGKCAIIRMNYEGPAYLIEGVKVLGDGQYHKILGIFFGNIIRKYLKYNWEIKIKDFEEQVLLWRDQNISILGRVLVLNLKFLSKFSYMLGILNLPTKYLAKMNELIYKFMNKGRACIQVQTLQLSKTIGGLGVIDLKDKGASLKVHFMKVCFYPDENDLMVAKYVRTFLQYFLGHHVRRDTTISMPLNSAYEGTLSLEQITSGYTFFQEMFLYLKKFVTLNMTKDLETVSSSNYYKYLQENKKNTKCSFGHNDFSDATKEEIWKNIFLQALDNKVLSFNYKLVYGGVNSLAKTYSGQPLIQYRPAWCKFCYKFLNIWYQVEDSDHIFFNCVVARNVWKYIKNKMETTPQFPVYGHTRVSRDGVNFTYVVDQSKILYKANISKIEAFFLSEVIHQIWKNRCKNNFNKENVHNLDHVSVIANLKGKLKTISRIDRNYLKPSKYNARWSFLNTLIDIL